MVNEIPTVMTALAEETASNHVFSFSASARSLHLLSQICPPYKLCHLFSKTECRSWLKKKKKNCDKAL